MQFSIDHRFDNVLYKGFPNNFNIFLEPPMTVRCREEYLITPLPVEEPLGAPMARWAQGMDGGTTTRRLFVRFVNCLCEFEWKKM